MLGDGAVEKLEKGFVYIKRMGDGRFCEEIFVVGGGFEILVVEFGDSGGNLERGFQWDKLDFWH